MRLQQRRELESQLRISLQAKAAELRALLDQVSDHWGYEDPIYRFYHQSYKVYLLQESTTEIVQKLQSLLPNCPLNDWFIQILREGTGKEFEVEHNDRWLPVTRPIVEAFFHARYFLEMACRYSDAPTDTCIPSGWAAFLYLFNLR